MNYKKIYDTLIEKRQQNPLPDEIYGENHHIVPRCMGGKDIKQNLIRFTAREHYIAHALLTKIYPNNLKLLFAFNAMCNLKGKSHKRYYKVNSYLYEHNKIKYANYIHTKLTNENSPAFGKKALINIKTGKMIKVKNPMNYLITGLWKINSTAIKQGIYVKNKETNVISLINYTEKYFLENPNCIWIPNYNCKIFKKCKNNVFKNANYNKIWIRNKNKTLEQLINKDDIIPDNWERGRIPKSNAKTIWTKGRIWILNNTKHLTSMINPDLKIPDGWELGRNQSYKFIKI